MELQSVAVTEMKDSWKLQSVTCIKEVIMSQKWYSIQDTVTMVDWQVVSDQRLWTTWRVISAVLFFELFAWNSLPVNLSTLTLLQSL